jgi:hypothetical protein
MDACVTWKFKFKRSEDSETETPTYSPPHPLRPIQSAPILCSRFPPSLMPFHSRHNKKPRVASAVEALRGALCRTSIMIQVPPGSAPLDTLHLCPLTSRTTGTACCCAASSLRSLDRGLFQNLSIPFLFRFNGKPFALEVMDISLPTLWGHVSSYAARSTNTSNRTALVPFFVFTPRL